MRNVGRRCNESPAFGRVKNTNEKKTIEEFGNFQITRSASSGAICLSFIAIILSIISLSLNYSSYTVLRA